MSTTTQIDPDSDTTAALTVRGRSLPRPLEPLTLLTALRAATQIAIAEAGWFGLIGVILLGTFLWHLAVWPIIILTGYLGVWLYASRLPTNRTGAIRALCVAFISVDLQLALTHLAWISHHRGAGPLHHNHPFWSILIGLATMQLLHRLPGGDHTPPTWRSHDQLVRSLQRAGVLPVPRDDEPLPKIRFRGRPDLQYAEDGTTLVSEQFKIDLEDTGTHHGELTDSKAVARIVSKIPGARDDLFEISHDNTDPSTCVTIWRGYELPARPPVAVPGRTRWEHGTDLARTRRGKLIRYLPIGPDGAIHTFIVGITGAGKTVLARWIVTHAIKDPDVEIVALVFKDDDGTGEWAAMKARCSLYIGGFSDQAIDAIEPTVLALIAEGERRGQLPAAQRRPLLLLTEEWFVGRTMLANRDAAAAARVDKLFASAVATMRSRRWSWIGLAQRSTADSFPTVQKINVAQRFVGHTSRADTSNALDLPRTEQPPTLPVKRQFLVKQDGTRGAELIDGPYLTDDQFAQACADGTRMWLAEGTNSFTGRNLYGEGPTLKVNLRKHTAPAAPTVSLRKPPRPAERVASRLELEVVVILEEAGRPVLATHILQRLSPQVRPTDARALGYRLRELADLGVVRRAPAGKSSGWALTSSPAAPLDSAAPLSPTPATTTLAPPQPTAQAATAPPRRLRELPPAPPQPRRWLPRRSPANRHSTLNRHLARSGTPTQELLP